MCRSWIKVYIAFGRLVTHATFCCCQCVVLQVFIIFFLSIRWLDAQNGSLSFLFVDFMTFGPVFDLERNFFFQISFLCFFLKNRNEGVVKWFKLWWPQKKKYFGRYGPFFLFIYIFGPGVNWCEKKKSVVLFWKKKGRGGSVWWMRLDGMFPCYS